MDMDVVFHIHGNPGVGGGMGRSKGPVDMKSMIFRGRTDRQTHQKQYSIRFYGL